MKRQLIVVGVAAFALLLLAFISATLAGPGIAPGNAPLVATEDPNDDNDDWNTADPVPVPGYITGELTQTGSIGDSQDYFILTTTIGSNYEAVLSIQYSQNDMSAEMTLYRGDQLKVSGPETTISWSAITTTYYIRVDSVPAMTTTAQVVGYRLNIDEIAPSSTSPPSATPTNTPPPSITEGDNYETNDSFGAAYELPVATSVTLSTLEGEANFYPGDSDKDWFKFWAKNGKWYQVTTSGLSGVDTYLQIRNQNETVIASNDDGGGGYASQTSWQSAYDGYYYIRVTNRVNTSGAYNMTVEESDAPPAEATATPVSPSSGIDDCEDNSDFERACVIATDKSYTFNLVPPFSGTDNDYFKFWIKPGFIYECATSDLDPGIDPNMIVYDHNQNGIGGNDDIEPGNYNSAFSYYASYEGWLYVLVGTGDRTPSDMDNSNYTLLCERKTPGQASTSTPTPSPTSSAATPTPTSPPGDALTPPDEITIRPMTTPTPIPESNGAPASRFIPINLLVYYDGNDDHQPGAGEGVSGISAQAYEAAANQLLAQGFTDEQGNLEFTVAAQGPVRVSIPFFGFSQLVANEEGASIYLRIPPQTLPGETP
ncbi:MAG: hypothetical protein B6I35_01825 [Anaerolineaceae bacterium 4572_32.2]|nr:MAG: hypothetical protein B6I35_01825 [Anaerolineaceae bacterium 4572_32.2]HEY71809.1 hypothetical protein [Thermoflexia bacterium]